MRFGPFEANLKSGRLRRNGLRVKLPVQSFQVLAMLLERPGEPVSREELRNKLWPDGTFVDFEHGLNAAVNRLREALGDSAEQPTYIETLPRRGYQFIASVEYVAGPVAPAKQPRPRLGRAALLVATVLLAVAAIWLWQWRQERGVSAPIRSLAVLPLENLSGDPAQEYFADGMTDALITQLASTGSVRVISRTSVMRFKGTKKPLPEIARALNVDAVVEGTVARSGQRVRITAQLIQASTDQHLWAGAYERDMKDLLALEDEVARAIANEIRTTLTPHPEVRLARARAADPGVHEAYLKGRYFWNKRTPEGLKAALGYFQQATDKDPNYALAYAGLADTYVVLADQEILPPQEGAAQAKAAALKALEIDSGLAEAHTALAMVLFESEWDWAGSEKEFQQALSLNPSYAPAHHWYAFRLAAEGRHEEALREIRLAQTLDPLSLIINANVGYMMFSSRQYDQALEQYGKTLELDPNFRIAHLNRARAYVKLGRSQEAIEELRAIHDSTNDPDLLLAYAYAMAGQRKQALGILIPVQERSKKVYVSPVFIALGYGALGERDKAFAQLERAYSQRDTHLVMDLPWPDFDVLRDDPRLQSLRRRMNFPDR